MFNLFKKEKTKLHKNVGKTTVTVKMYDGIEYMSTFYGYLHHGYYSLHLPVYAETCFREFLEKQGFLFDLTDFKLAHSNKPVRKYVASKDIKEIVLGEREEYNIEYES